MTQLSEVLRISRRMEHLQEIVEELVFENTHLLAKVKKNNDEVERLGEVLAELEMRLKGVSDDTDPEK